MIIAGASSRLIAASSRPCRPGSRRSAAKPPAAEVIVDDRAGIGGRPRRSRRTAGADDLPEFADPAALPAMVRVAAAARAFSAGNGYLSGLIVDRLA